MSADLSSPPLSTAPKASLNAFFRLLAHSPKAECFEADGLFRYRTALPHHWFNGILASRPPAGDESAVIRETQSYFAARGVSSFTWWLEPEISSDAWAAQLLPGGFKVDRNTPGMVADLAALPTALPTLDGFAIQPVMNQAMLADWTVIFCRGYRLPEAWAQPFYELIEPLGMELPLRYYLGWLDGVSVAAATLFLEAGVAGIYNVAVLEAARGRGLGAAITLVPLQDARAMGYSYAALQSSELGFHVYQRLGFQKTCDMTHFYYFPA